MGPGRFQTTLEETHMSKSLRICKAEITGGSLEYGAWELTGNIDNYGVQLMSTHTWCCIWVAMDDMVALLWGD